MNKLIFILLFLVSLSASGQNFFWSHTGASEPEPEPEPCTEGYGLLYNWPSVVDARGLLATGWHIPTYLEHYYIDQYLTGTEATIKESGTAFWDTANGSNTEKFNARGSGYRNTDGTFSGLKYIFQTWGQLYTSFPYVGSMTYFTLNNILSVSAGVGGFGNARSVRPIKDSTTLSNGQSGIYTGTDGKIYRTICINGYEILADNLAETRFRNGDIIPFHGADNDSTFTNAEWAALTTAGVCAFNNDVSNVGCNFTFPTE